MQPETFNSPIKEDEKGAGYDDEQEREIKDIFPTLGLRSESIIKPKVMIHQYSSNSKENSVNEERVVVMADPSINLHLMDNQLQKIELDDRGIIKEVAIILFYYSVALSCLLIFLFHGHHRLSELYTNGDLFLCSHASVTVLSFLFMMSVAGLSLFPRIDRELFTHLRWFFCVVCLLSQFYLIILIFAKWTSRGRKATVVCFYVLIELFIVHVMLSISHINFRRYAFMFSVGLSLLFTVLTLQSINTFVNHHKFSPIEMIQISLLSFLYIVYINLDFLFITGYHYRDYTKGDGIRVFGDFCIDFIYRFWFDLYRMGINKFRIFI